MPRNFDHLLQRVEFIVVASMRPRQMPRNFGRVSIALAYAAFASMRPRQMPRNFILIERRHGSALRSFNEAAADAAEFSLSAAFNPSLMSWLQ